MKNKIHVNTSFFPKEYSIELYDMKILNIVNN